MSNPLRDGSSSGSTSSSPMLSSSSGSASGVNPMWRSSFKMDAASPASGNSNRPTEASSSSTTTSAAPSAAGGGLEEVKEELLDDFDGNADSGLVLPSHSHLRLSDSKLYYSRVSDSTDAFNGVD